MGSRQRECQADEEDPRVLISELAELTGVSARALRHYEDRLRPHRRAWNLPRNVPRTAGGIGRRGQTHRGPASRTQRDTATIEQARIDRWKHLDTIMTRSN
ncbi:MerR family DNA-binding transcriptional regulator [Nocardia sp. NPDC051787]|uniref:MerR family DNA-binding transcriptional regulator n=1 Tax=Nocardia sp. NPDC051787 TaxID=3155415 RepID=UPI0034312FBB